MNSESKQSRPRLLLVGLGPTAATALESLAERFEVVGLVRPSATADATLVDPVIERARQLGAAIIGDATAAAIEGAVRELKPACVVVSSFHRILPDALLRQCRFVNVHYALLPKYRGRANVNWAVINGERFTGISIHEMAPGLDAGNILFQAAVPIGERDTVTDLYERLNAIQRTALATAVQRMLDGDGGEPQDETRATYGCMRVPDDGEIGWSESTEALERLVRALGAPFPGAFTYFEGKRLIVWRAQRLVEAPRYEGRVPGRVVRVSRSEGWVDVLTGDGVLRLFEVQRDNEDETAAAAELVRSVKATLGLRTMDLLRRIEQLEQALQALAEVRQVECGELVDRA